MCMCNCIQYVYVIQEKKDDDDDNGDGEIAVAHSQYASRETVSKFYQRCKSVEGENILPMVLVYMKNDGNFLKGHGNLLQQRSDFYNQIQNDNRKQFIDFILYIWNGVLDLFHKQRLSKQAGLRLKKLVIIDYPLTEGCRQAFQSLIHSLPALQLGDDNVTGIPAVVVAGVFNYLMAEAKKHGLDSSHLSSSSSSSSSSLQSSSLQSSSSSSPSSLSSSKDAFQSLPRATSLTVFKCFGWACYSILNKFSNSTKSTEMCCVELCRLISVPSSVWDQSKLPADYASWSKGKARCPHEQAVPIAELIVSNIRHHMSAVNFYYDGTNATKELHKNCDRINNPNLFALFCQSMRNFKTSSTLGCLEVLFDTLTTKIVNLFIGDALKAAKDWEALNTSIDQKAAHSSTLRESMKHQFSKSLVK